ARIDLQISNKAQRYNVFPQIVFLNLLQSAQDLLFSYRGMFFVFVPKGHRLSPLSRSFDPSLLLHFSRRHTVILRPNVNVLVPRPGVVDQDPVILFQESGMPQLFHGRNASASLRSDEQTLGSCESLAAFHNLRIGNGDRHPTALPDSSQHEKVTQGLWNTQAAGNGLGIVEKLAEFGILLEGADDRGTPLRLNGDHLRTPGADPAELFKFFKCFPHTRSEEHTSELQSRVDLVCRLLLEQTKHHQV